MEDILDCISRPHPEWITIEKDEDETSNFRSLSGKIQQLDRPIFSVEFFPPRNERGAINLVRLIDQYVQGGPMFCDITWHVGSGLTKEGNGNSPTSSMTMAEVALHYCSVDTMLHITCIGMTKSILNKILYQAKDLGIRNILALRGDRDVKYETTTNDFKYACDMISYIRTEYGRYFTVVVAGYPVPHPESISMEHDIQCLKHKVDAGADFIITQMFFRSEDFFQFFHRCRNAGIKVPIIPGICAINTYDSLMKFARLSGVEIPEELINFLEPVKMDTEAVCERGISFLTQLCRSLLEQQVQALHFYTLNKNTMIRVIKNLGLWRQASLTREILWIPAAYHLRIDESVRPVFWCQRPRTYIHRTKKWDEFPSKKWIPDCHSERLSSTNIDDYYEFLKINLNVRTEKFLSEFRCYDDVYRWFYQYYSLARFDICDEKNNNEFDEKSALILPWIQYPNSYAMERLFHQYHSYIRLGLMIINYLPRIDEPEKSSDLTDGQKQYIDFFIEPNLWKKLEKILRNYPYKISFMISNNDASFIFGNHPEKIVIPVSWNKISGHPQSIRKYIADKRTFDVWRSEAFGIFNQIIDTNGKNIGPESVKLFQEIRDNFLLVSLVEEFPDQLEIIFQQLFEKPEIDQVKIRE